MSMHIYQIRLRKDKRGFDLISDALPSGRLWYGEPNAVVGLLPAWGRWHALRLTLQLFRVSVLGSRPPRPWNWTWGLCQLLLT